ncbi:hypothetical protein BDV38DRAFT_265153 [Aspergillus pseudotamarii]|uniref:Uncharacterized protein n=1 Tax=Aspergillus pseudotamarii TaxID=132259 RepID=A0A5N6SB83_ASPPS|nr:uncharacterized protein BDV38DRAFT_265153 [Aspergillus pseudotamarii]KAE8131207.1 hypothetical protein BDV38DRAFT_265153 [Aspergillus pseudotamarii]
MQPWRVAICSSCSFSFKTLAFIAVYGYHILYTEGKFSSGCFLEYRQLSNFKILMACYLVECV